MENTDQSGTETGRIGQPHVPPLHQYKSTTHDERFAHFKVESEKYSHATVFARQEADGMFWMALSFCWKLDQFDRSIGRKSARRHYFADPTKHVYLGGAFVYEEIAKWVANRVQAATHPSKP